MHDTTKSDFYHGSGVRICTKGEFIGWSTWRHDGYIAHSGPFWHRQEEDGTIRCAFRVEKKHLNGLQHVHGGCLMAFADYCLFAIASPVLQKPAVTTNFACEFLDAGCEGDLIVGTGEVTRAGGSLVFLRGKLTAGERTLFTFSGTMKQLKRRTLPQPDM